MKTVEEIIEFLEEQIKYRKMALTDYGKDYEKSERATDKSQAYRRYMIAYTEGTTLEDVLNFIKEDEE